MENAGTCDMSMLAQPIALEAAKKLGCLQKGVLGDQQLPSLVAHCEGSQLQQQVLDICSWAINQQKTPGAIEELQRIASHVEQAHSFFDKLENQLSELPATIVHGDFWSGNIAVAEGNIRFVDWGDALWGVGGISLVNLIMTSDGLLDKAAPDLWEAYEQGSAKT
jgi:fructosamine-3-kinase